MIRAERWRCFAGGGPLARPVGNARSTWRRRDGLILELVGGGDCTGQGEASPLPGTSRESLADCRAALADLDLAGLALAAQDVATGAPVLGALSALGPRHARLPPAARAAVEAAWLDLVGHATERPAWSLLGRPGAPAPASRPVSALLRAESPDEVAREAASARASGIRCVKLKIGRPGALATELELARAIRATAPELALRLDANRAFTLDEARRAVEAFAALGCELMEEPTAELDVAACAAGDARARGVARELAAWPVEVALDESLRDLPAGALRAVAQDGFPAAVILKPMILGGITRSLELAAEAAELGVDVVVTHAFEGPLGLAVAAVVALRCGSVHRAMGLLPHAGLHAWPARRVPALLGITVAPYAEPGFGVAPFAPEVAP